jgi:hypothetical protein
VFQWLLSNGEVVASAAEVLRATRIRMGGRPGWAYWHYLNLHLKEIALTTEPASPLPPRGRH